MKLWQIVAPDSCLESGQNLLGRELLEYANGYVEQLLEHGARPCSQVIVLLTHDERGMALYLAASRIGCELVLPYNLSSMDQEAMHQLRKDFNDALVCVTDGYEELKGVVRLRWRKARHPEALPEPGLVVERFLLLFTSGSSGSPKSVSVSEAVVTARIEAVAARLGFHSAMRSLLCGLMSNTTGVIFGFGPLMCGGTVVIPASRNVAQWPKVVERDRVTHLMLRPASLEEFLRAAEFEGCSLDSVETFAYGSAPLAQTLRDRLSRITTGRLVQGYGLSETYGPFIWTEEGCRDPDGYLIGTPDTTESVEIIHPAGMEQGPGELVITSGLLMNGYLTAGAPYPHLELPFRTGDIAFQDVSGNFHLVGRRSATVLTTNGHQIFPEQVERIAAEVCGPNQALLVGLWEPEGSRAVLVFSPTVADDQIRSTAICLMNSFSPETLPDDVAVMTNLSSSENEKLRRVTPKKEELSSRRPFGRVLL
ncbi:AMP-binding enzyme [Actinomyces johnsonii F0542]|uniref:AMP-binding enzyme n=2 Tax=Actinomyces johnsonii TaxID=544581 RepID=U1S5K8_9ACTO|nr:fatty acid--CoA ligase family protein [Actinomyces johnsonii]ERH25917.1 AMP-binding enzyme [Actinomyces johnsonii F0542]